MHTDTHTHTRAHTRNHRASIKCQDLHNSCNSNLSHSNRWDLSISQACPLLFSHLSHQNNHVDLSWLDLCVGEKKIKEKKHKTKNSSFAPDFNKTKTEDPLKMCSSLPSSSDNRMCRYISALTASKGSKKVYFSFSSYSLISSPDKLFLRCVSSPSEFTRRLSH